MALYNFVDTWKENTQGTAILSESFTINGVRIESAVNGFRTLYAKGRESLSAEVETIERGRADGATFKYKRYPERVITVGYQIRANDAATFREAYNQLASALNVEQAQFIFDDEPDKFFIGTPTEMGDVEAGHNTVTGEFTIFCTDPFKYSVEEYSVDLQRNSENTIEYGGTVPAVPRIESILDGASGGDIVGTASWFELYRLNDAVLAFTMGDDAEPAEKIADLSIPESGTGSAWTRYYTETTFDSPVNNAMCQGHFQYESDDATNCYRFIAKLNLNGGGANYSPSIEIWRDYSNGVPQTELRFKVGDTVVHRQYLDDSGSNDFPFRISYERGLSLQSVAKGYMVMYFTFQFGDFIYNHKTSASFTTNDTEYFNVASALIEYGKYYMSTGTVTRSGSMFVVDTTVQGMENIFVYGVPHVVDVENARLYMDGLYTPYPNNPANNWSDFKLINGTNKVTIRSSGVASGYFSGVLKYREVFI